MALTKLFGIHTDLTSDPATFTYSHVFGLCLPFVVTCCRPDLVGYFAYIWFQLQINLIRRRTPVLLQVYLPSGLFVLVSWISFIVPPEIVPGKRAKIQISTLLISLNEEQLLKYISGIWVSQIMKLILGQKLLLGYKHERLSRSQTSHRVLWIQYLVVWLITLWGFIEILWEIEMFYGIFLSGMKRESSHTEKKLHSRFDE